MSSNFGSFVIRDESHIRDISRRIDNQNSLQKIIFSEPNNCYLINKSMDGFEAKTILLEAVKNVSDKTYLLLERGGNSAKLIQEILIVGFTMEKKLLQLARQTYYAFKYENTNGFEEVEF
ncbi:MAG: hypothetical protein MJ252_09495 [archaeon]|nr:hypothetical protein [archaeon]